MLVWRHRFKFQNQVLQKTFVRNSINSIFVHRCQVNPMYLKQFEDSRIAWPMRGMIMCFQIKIINSINFFVYHFRLKTTFKPFDVFFLCVSYILYVYASQHAFSICAIYFDTNNCKRSVNQQELLPFFTLCLFIYFISNFRLLTIGFC